MRLGRCASLLAAIALFAREAKAAHAVDLQPLTKDPSDLSESSDDEATPFMPQGLRPYRIPVVEELPVEDARVIAEQQALRLQAPRAPTTAPEPTRGSTPVRVPGPTAPTTANLQAADPVCNKMLRLVRKIDLLRGDYQLMQAQQEHDTAEVEEVAANNVFFGMLSGKLRVRFGMLKMTLFSRNWKIEKMEKKIKVLIENAKQMRQSNPSKLWIYDPAPIADVLQQDRAQCERALKEKIDESIEKWIGYEVDLVDFKKRENPGGVVNRMKYKYMQLMPLKLSEITARHDLEEKMEALKVRIHKLMGMQRGMGLSIRTPPTVSHRRARRGARVITQEEARAYMEEILDEIARCRKKMAMARTLIDGSRVRYEAEYAKAWFQAVRNNLRENYERFIAGNATIVEEMESRISNLMLEGSSMIRAGDVDNSNIPHAMNPLLSEDASTHTIFTLAGRGAISPTLLRKALLTNNDETVAMMRSYADKVSMFQEITRKTQGAINDLVHDAPDYKEQASYLRSIVKSCVKVVQGYESQVVIHNVLLGIQNIVASIN